MSSPRDSRDSTPADAAAGPAALELAKGDPELHARILAALDVAVRRLGSVHDLETTLQAIVAGAVDAVAGADQASIVMRADGTFTSRAATDERSAALDRLQIELAEGPCVDAILAEHTVHVDDLPAEDSRWPAFAARASALGTLSILSFRLYTDSDSLGALTLYASAASAFGTESRLLGELFASHATIAVADAVHVNHLGSAVATRDVIGQAKGILMERLGISAQEAFHSLVEASSQTNLKLVDVAQWLTANTAAAGQPAESRRRTRTQRPRQP